MSWWLMSISLPSPSPRSVIWRADSDATDWTRETAPATATEAARPMPTATAKVQRRRSRTNASRPVQRAGPPGRAMAALSAAEGPMSTPNDQPRFAPRRPPPPPPGRGSARRRPPAAAASLLLVVAVAAGYYVLRPQSGPPPAHPPARLAVLITSLCFASD